MCVGKLSHALYIGPGMGNQRNWKNTHQGPVPIVPNRASTAKRNWSATGIPLDRVAGSPAHVENFIIRGKYPMNQPRRKIAHYISRVNGSTPPNAFQRCKGHAAIIRPCTGRLIVCPVAGHIRSRESVPPLKLKGNAQGIPNHKAHDPVINFSHVQPSFQFIHLMTVSPV